MDNAQETDSVWQHVRYAAQKFRVPSDAAITQQILLFADSFYGYRYTAPNFMAIWSAADHVLKVFDSAGRVLEVLPVTENTGASSVESIPLILQRRAA